ncbi:MAG TPA: DUF1843 domain-containing protein [Longimicrobium sp.]|nr:DUF1843 domain-containing protein [Longimicrobium sp.]
MNTPIPPYGVAIQEAIASGDTARMRQVQQDAEAFLKQAEEVRESLAKLREHLGQNS